VSTERKKKPTGILRSQKRPADYIKGQKAFKKKERSKKKSVNGSGDSKTGSEQGRLGKTKKKGGGIR